MDLSTDPQPMADNFAGGIDDSSAPAGARPGPRPRPVAGGWGFDGPSGGGMTSGVSGPSSAPVSTQQESNRHFANDEDDTVPIIPDLEEEAEEDITRQVAAPPAPAESLAAPAVKSVRELDSALSSRLAQLPTSPEEGVDLAPLMRCLCSERQVFEGDVPWDHELIFAEVASDIQAEQNNDVDQGEDGINPDMNNNAVP